MTQQIESILADVYDRYRAHGLDAVYLWGSALTQDFDPKTSDVDSIGIVSDTFPLSIEDQIKNYIAETYPDIKQFGFRALYVSELNGGERKGYLSKVLHPQILLLDLPKWKHVAGRKYEQSDFKLSVPSFDEAIRLRVERFQEAGWTDFGALSGMQSIYCIKQIARTLELMQNKRGFNDPFSYSSLVMNADSDEKLTALAILACKKSGWNEVVAKENHAIFQSFIDRKLEDISKISQ